MEDSKFQINDPPTIGCKFYPTRPTQKTYKQKRAQRGHNTPCFLAFPFSSVITASLSLSPFIITSPTFLSAFVFFVSPVTTVLVSFRVKKQTKNSVRIKEGTTFP